MAFHKEAEISGWGNTPKHTCTLHRPDSAEQIRTLATEHDGIIARGQGRSYGDAAVSEAGVLKTDQYQRILAVDYDTGVIMVQSGTTLHDIHRIMQPHGWGVPVLPGTRHVSAGGAFASNVHGKNHVAKGSFANHVHSIELLTASGDTLTCSAEKNPELFWATAGGMGLTGIIETLTIQLEPNTSNALQVEYSPTHTLHDIVKKFETTKDTHEFRVAWIDHCKKDAQLGKGIFEAANWSPQKRSEKAKRSVTIPSWAPRLASDNIIRLYNRRRFARHASIKDSVIVPAEQFLYPLDAIQHWNRLYGKNGFYQYQCVLPEHEDNVSQLYDMLSKVREMGLMPYLTVIKQHGAADPSPLGFAMQGYSVAMDFPAHPKLERCIDRLNQTITHLGGRVYLAKDALLDATNFESIYAQNLDAWREIVQHHDPNGKWQSAMSKRLYMQGVSYD